jgi:hypothetical protein
MVTGRAFSAGISIFELFVNVSLLFPPAEAGEEFGITEPALDEGEDVFEFEEMSIGTPLLD